jgi:hypothetical protein
VIAQEVNARENQQNSFKFYPAAMLLSALGHNPPTADVNGKITGLPHSNLD